jgi:hypothetical protein
LECTCIDFSAGYLFDSLQFSVLRRRRSKSNRYPASRCFPVSPGLNAPLRSVCGLFTPRQQGLSHAPTSPLRMRATFLYYALPCLPVAWSSVTVYYQQPFGATTSSKTTAAGASSAAAASYTGAAAYDPTILTPPPIPDPAPPTTFFQQLSSAPVPGLSIPQSGYFFGFSVEFSVITQVCEWTLHTCILNIH